MGTEDETELTMQGRATAAAGAALVAACIVNPLDVIKTRIQAQAMAESAGPRGCSTPWTCSSTLYEHITHHPHSLHHTHGLSDCQHHQHAGNPAAARPWLPQRHAHTLSPEAAAWWFGSHHSTATATFPKSSSSMARLALGTASSSASSSGHSSATAAAAAALSAARSAAANMAAAAAAAFRRWGITEGPLPIRRTPPFPVPNGWVPPPVAVTPTAAAAAAAGALQVPGAAASALATATAPCPACFPQQQPAAFQTTSMWEMAKAISKAEGLPVLWRGTTASLLIAVPMVGIYMPLYDHLLDSWSSKLGSVAPVVAGTAARTAACFCVAPFELLRTRLQASAAAGVSMRSTLSSFVTEHHHAAAASAATAPAAAGTTASTAAKAAAATAFKAAAAAPSQQPAAAAAAAARGAVSAVQQQPQAAIRPATVLMAVPRMWTGFSATLVRDVPFSALYWALVEPLRQAMLPVNSHWPPLERLEGMIHKQQQQQRPSSSGGSNSSSGGSSSGNSSSSSSSSGRLAAVPPSQQHLMHHSQLEILVANMVSGFVAGGFAAGITTPFDVAKTRMQIASPSQQQQQQALGASSSSSGGGSSRGLRVFYILRDVYQKEGVEGLFSGVKPRAARAAPACAIVISVYELLKSYLTPA